MSAARPSGTPHHVAGSPGGGPASAARPSPVAQRVHGAALPRASHRRPSLRHFPCPQVRSWAGRRLYRHGEDQSQRGRQCANTRHVALTYRHPGLPPPPAPRPPATRAGSPTPRRCALCEAMSGLRPEGKRQRGGCGRSVASQAGSSQREEVADVVQARMSLVCVVSFPESTGRR